MRARIRGALLSAVLLLAAAVIAINLAVRLLGGGAPALLSPLHLLDKATALRSLGTHLALHPFRSDDEIPPLLEASARRHRLPRSLLFAVAKAESDLLPHRISHAGAMGVMQLMPDTASRLRVGDPFDPRQNIDGGARYLRELWTRYRGDRERVLAAYNAGPGRVPRSGRLRVPEETRRYVHRVLSLARSRNLGRASS